MNDFISQIDEKNDPVLRPEFICRVCGAAVGPILGGGRQRNHCPVCLCSLHLDDLPGDRSADCGGVMDPVGVWVRKNGEWAIIHRCRQCGVFHSNRVAADDNPLKLISIAVKPLASPPFPIEQLEGMMKEEPFSGQKK